MRGHLNEARQVVVDALDGVPFLSAWAFEYTPSSSESADDTYLRHVRDADFVIWLAGAEVSQPVLNEVREALVARRRLIIIRYGTGPRTAGCTGLLDEVGLRAKYADALDLAELRQALELAMGDEIVRALRGEPDMGRLAHIQALGKASLARCAGGTPSSSATSQAVSSEPVILRSLRIRQGNSSVPTPRPSHTRPPIDPPAPPARSPDDGTSSTDAFQQAHHVSNP